VTATATPARSTTDDLRTALTEDFRAACDEHSRARDLRAAKDSRAHRTAVTESLARIDALLDMYLETRG
jgi:hypothetical protein